MTMTLKTKVATKKRGLMLETTVQIDRIAGDFKRREKTISGLYNRPLFTTSFVFREFLRTIITDIIFVHDAVEKIEPKLDTRVALSNLLAFLGSGQGNFSARSAQRQKYILAEIVDFFGEVRIDRRRLLDMLERLVEQWIDDFFEVTYKDGKEREVKCLKTLDEPGDLDKLKRCNPFPPKPAFPARAATFLDKHKLKVQLAEKAIKESKRRKREVSLLTVLEKLKNEKNEYDFLNKLKPTTRGNWHLGDLLIALETHPSLALYTTDGLFEIICPVFGKECYLYK